MFSDNNGDSGNSGGDDTGNSGNDSNDNTGDSDGGDSGGSSDSTDKTYVYTVSGAGTLGVDGNYWDTGETTRGPAGADLGYHIYTNGTAKIEFMIDYGQWSISLDLSQMYSIVWDDDEMTTGTTTIAFGDNPAPTISKYTGGGNS